MTRWLRAWLYGEEATTFRQMRALFNETSTLQQKPEYAKPIDRKFRLWRGGQFTGQRRFAA